MTDKISRRDFLKIAGAGAAVTSVLTGCGPVSRYVVREPYTQMPEYNYNGQSTYYATTCRECAAACGIIVRTMQGRAIKVEGNKLHPVNKGKTCSRGQATLQGLYNPDRIKNPIDQSGKDLAWDEAINVVADALKGNGAETAFLTGLAPDHVYDMFSQLAAAIGAPAPLRFGALGMFEARTTLAEAAKAIYGKASMLYFDLANADVTFSFGANFLETWVSPVAQSRGFASMRQGKPGRRGYLVQFEPRMSQTGMVADEWIPVKPGTEGLVALAIGRLAAEIRGGALPGAFSAVDVDAAAEASGVERETLERLATIFADGTRPLALPGGAALGQANGLQTAEAVLALNGLVGNSGKEGGVYMTPALGIGEDSYHAPATARQMAEFIKKMNDGKVKVLFVHGVNPVFELPDALGFAEAMKNVPLVISFASFPDETAKLANYVFPDHTALESWGYQRIWTGSDRAAISGGQPAVAPFYDTRSTVDVFLAAAELAGGKAASALAFKDEVEFLQAQVIDLVSEQGGLFGAGEINTFWAQWQQFGGWWKTDAGLEAPQAPSLGSAIKVEEPRFEGEGEFLLVAYPSPILGDGSGANRPWLQETPDPCTTVMWNSWVEINPDTAHELGLENDDVVEISSPAGKVEAVVYKYPAIRPDVIAIPFGQGHTALGRYAEGRGVNPLALVSAQFNEAGDLAFAATKVEIKKTGRQRPIARMESVMGVYGDGMEEH